MRGIPGFLRSVTEWMLRLSDVTDNDVSTSKHGFTPKAPNDTTKFLRGDGAWATPSSSAGAADPIIYTDRSWEHYADTDGTSYSSTGLDFTISGTGSSLADNDNDGRWIRNTTGGVSGNTAQLQAISGMVGQRSWSLIHGARMKTFSTISSMRFWCGLFSAAPEASDDPSAHLAAFRYSTNASDTDWMCCVKDGTTLNAQSSGVSVAADTMYLFRVETDSSEVRFYINGSLVYTHSSNLPGINTALGYHIGVTTLTGASRSWRYCRQFARYRG